MDEPKAGLRERTRNMVRAELAQAAVQLFVEQGFEATTVEQIAAATGLSRRSFHRYFSSKEDVFGQWFAEMGRQLAAALASRPTEERAWFALRRAFDDLIQGMSEQPQSLLITRMILQTPALHATHLQKHALWRDTLAEVLRDRLSEDGRELGQIAALALVGAALAALDSAQSQWVREDNEEPLGDLLDQAMNAIAPLTEPAAPSPQSLPSGGALEPPQVSPSTASHSVSGPAASMGRRSLAAVSPYIVHRAQFWTVFLKRWSSQKLLWPPPRKVRNALGQGISS
jgi:AcrR family transcriptional regulator